MDGFPDFVQNGVMTMQSTQTVDPSAISSSEMFCCKYCPRNDFKNEHGLNIHIAKAHKQDMERQHGSLIQEEDRHPQPTGLMRENLRGDPPLLMSTKQSLTPSQRLPRVRDAATPMMKSEAASIVQTDALLKCAHPGNNHRHSSEQMKTTKGAGARPKETPKNSHSPKDGHRQQTPKKQHTADRDQARSCFDERKSSGRPSPTHEYKTKPNPQSTTPEGQRRRHSDDEIRRHAANIVQTDALLKGAHPGNNHRHSGEQMKTTNGAGARPKETPKKSHSPKDGHSQQTPKKQHTADRDQARSCEVFSCPVCPEEYKYRGCLNRHMKTKHPTYPSGERGMDNHGSREEKKSQKKDRSSSKASNFAESFNIKTFEKWVNLAEASIVRQRRDTDSTIRCMNRFVDNLQSTIDGISKFPLKTLKSGSYYDRTKIDYDDEFDFMFYPDVKFEAVFTNCPPGYCKIRKGARVNKDIDQYLDSKGFLVPEKFKEEMFKIFETALENRCFREGRRTKRQTRKPESPAFTVLFDLGILDKSPIDVDLVPAIKIESWPETAREIRPNWVKEETAERAKRCFHAVMKTYPGNWQDKDLLWRMSFSNAEKELILHANEKEKGCRKDIFKILKKIKEVMKTRKPEIDKFCSYHLKMFMLRFYEKNDDFRNENERKLSLLKVAIHELAMMVKRGEIPNYFIPRDNVIMSVPEEERQIIYNELLDLLEERWT